MLLYCLRCALKPSASTISISKLYQHFRERDLPYGLQNSLFLAASLANSVLNPSCSPSLPTLLRHRSKARYGWVANPSAGTSQRLLPTGTFTLQDTPSFPRRDNAGITRSASAASNVGCIRLLAKYLFDSEQL